MKQGAGRGRNAAGPGWLPLALAIGVVTGLAAGCRPSGAGAGEVVIYASQDQVYAEPILRQFEQESGLRVKALYDAEAVKTVGLAQRLVSERARPNCDVFWNNELLRTRQLAGRGVLTAGEGWAVFGWRSRRLVINTNLLPAAQAPASLLELTNSVWRGRVVLAYPLFGTTAAHFAALRQKWGEAGWLAWCRGLQANQARLVDGNSVVVQTVGRGDVPLGLTDSDDIAAGRREGLPVAALPLTGEMLLIPNSVAVVEGAPHPQAARQLVAWLGQPEVAQRLVEAGALESAGAAPEGAAALEADWSRMAAEIEETGGQLREIFLR